MRTLRVMIAAAAIGLGAGGAASAGAVAEMARADASVPAGRLISGVYSGQAVTLEKTQYFWGGRRYCWYDGGWRGPGWYYCGYAWRRGFGWGGPVGWRGWRGGGWHDRGWHGEHRGRGWHGGGEGRGDGDWHGGGRGEGWRDGDRGGHHPH